MPLTPRSTDELDLPPKFCGGGSEIPAAPSFEDTEGIADNLGLHLKILSV
ncbi:MAG: hypothetical protein WD029_10495 [Microthrixaceae bacterium]